MGYQFDAFISYPHNPIHEEWVRDIFLDIFRNPLENALGWSPRLFYDREGIESGDEWPAQLKIALAKSKILVPIWSVQYFRSPWCRAECAVIRDRELKLGYRTLKNPRGLMHPIRLFDGKNYPVFANKVQFLDCKDFNHVGKAFKESLAYLKLQDKLEEWTEQVAESIQMSPEWMDEWQDEDLLEDLVTKAKFDPDFQPK